MNLYRSILITGGGGMLAHALAEALATRGFSFHAARRAECDITQPEQVRAVFEKLRPSLVLNCAAHTGVDACEDEVGKAYAINADGPATLAALCDEFDAKLVHYSTDYVFDGLSDRPYRPDDPARPASVYGKSKLAGEERILQQAGLSSLVIRTAWLFGGHGDCFPAKMLKLAQRHKPFSVVNDQWGSPTYTTDLAESTMALLDVGASGIVHVTNGPATNWHEFAVQTLLAFGEAADVRPISTEDWLKIRPKQAPRPSYGVLDNELYTSLTGRTPRNWRAALEEFAACAAPFDGSAAGKNGSAISHSSAAT